MSNHTPGPWRYDYEPGFCGELLAPNGTNIAEFITEPNDSDARLIAAAPDLLAALQKFVAWSEAESSHEGTTFWERVEMLRELDAAAAVAIAKATGEQT